MIKKAEPPEGRSPEGLGLTGWSYRPIYSPQIQRMEIWEAMFPPDPLMK